ncbi:MAG: hypothetical protein AAF485_15790 [Chloroflexota bacterium]
MSSANHVYAQSNSQDLIVKVGISCFLALGLALLWTAVAQAKNPGDLDITFGGTGVVTTVAKSDWNGGAGMAIQPDDKIVFVGESIGDRVTPFTNPPINLAIARYTKDGDLDPTFRGTGFFTTPIANTSGWGKGVVIQDDGAIIATALTKKNTPFYHNSIYDLTLVRYKPNGDLDTSFNQTGIVTTTIDSSLVDNAGVALQSDGKILVAGDYAIDSNNDAILIARYTTTGNFDSTFDSTGLITTPIGSRFRVAKIVIQTNDKIVIVGTKSDSAKSIITLTRYNKDGGLDTSFNGSGVVTVSLTYSARASDVAIQPDEKIVIVGSPINSDASLLIIRYSKNGILDTSFNGSGVVTASITQTLRYEAVAIQPDKKIIVAKSIIQNDADLAILRLNENGTFDTTFGNTGVVTTYLSSRIDIIRSVGLQSNGKIIAGAYSNGGFPGIGEPSGYFDFALLRYLGDPYLTLSKTVNTLTPQPNDLITYTLTINNPSTITTTNTLISDALPLSLTLAGPVTLNPAQPDVIIATSPLSLPILAKGITITPNYTITLTVPVTVGSDIPAGLWLTNTATATSSEVTIQAEDTALIITSIISDPSISTYLPLILKETTSDLIPE